MPPIIEVAQCSVPKPSAVEVDMDGRKYTVRFHHVTGRAYIVEVHKAHGKTQRLNTNGPTALAAIAKANG